jgi:hypothetical protein
MQTNETSNDNPQPETPIPADRTEFLYQAL